VMAKFPRSSRRKADIPLRSVAMNCLMAMAGSGSESRRAQHQPNATE
jgi:hypothetical protein